jgi:hypothetical protein
MSKRLTIEEIDERIRKIENYYFNGHKANSIERMSWEVQDKRQLGRLYRIKQQREREKNDS